MNVRVSGPARAPDELELDRAGVLELVDEQVVEAGPLRLGDRLVAPQQLEREQLQVVEVDRRSLGLVAVEAAAELDQQPAQRLVSARDLVRLGGRRGLLAVVDPLDPELGQRRLDDPAVTEVGVGRQDDRAEPVPVAGRGQCDRIVAGGERRERLVERGSRDPRGLVGVEDPEPRIEAGRHRVGGEQAPAESVNRRDRGRLARPGGLLQPGPPARIAGGRGPTAELDPDATAHLRRRLLGEGEGEDPVRLDLVGVDRLAVPVDQDPGLAGSRARLEEDVAIAVVDRELLLLGRRPARLARGRRLPFGLRLLRCRRRRILGRRGLEAELLGAVHQTSSSSSSSSSTGIPRSTRQIGANPHQVGQEPSRGLRSIRPARISPTTRVASSSA